MPLRCCPFTHAVVNNILSEGMFVGNKMLDLSFALTEIRVNWLCTLALLELVSLARTLFSEAEAIIMSEPLTDRRKYAQTLDQETAAAPSAVLPSVVHLSRWRHGYESNFSSDLRIPHSLQCRAAFESLQCSPSQQKQNLWTVHQFTHAASKVTETWLPRSVTRRCLTFRINNSFVLWWM